MNPRVISSYQSVRHSWQSVRQIWSTPVSCNLMSCHAHATHGLTCHWHHSHTKPPPPALSLSHSHSFTFSQQRREKGEKRRGEEKQEEEEKEEEKEEDALLLEHVGELLHHGAVDLTGVGGGPQAQAAIFSLEHMASRSSNSFLRPY